MRSILMVLQNPAPNFCFSRQEKLRVLEKLIEAGEKNEKYKEKTDRLKDRKTERQTKRKTDRKT